MTLIAGGYSLRMKHHIVTLRSEIRFTFQRDAKGRYGARAAVRHRGHVQRSSWLEAESKRGKRAGEGSRCLDMKVTMEIGAYNCLFWPLC